MDGVNQIPSLQGRARLILDDNEFCISYSVHYRVGQVYGFFVVLIDVPDSIACPLAINVTQINVILDGRPQTTLQITKVTNNQIWCKPVTGLIDDANSETAEIAEVTASIVNFRFFRSKSSNDNYSLRDDEGVYFLGSTHFNVSGVDVEIRCTKDTDRAFKRLCEDGGFAVTHLLILKSVNSEMMSPKELKKLLANLHKTLSFANGAWVGIHDIKGFDALGNLTYLPITTYSCTRYQGRFGWFDSHHGNSLMAFAPKLFEMLDNEETAEIFERALYWYIRANNSEGTGIDTGIILATTGLELLVKYSIERFEVNVISSRKKKPPHLGDKVRAVALHHNIPINIDDLTSPQAFKLQQSNVWDDIPAAIVQYRNDLVHPTAKIKSDSPHTITIEIWRLSVWYLELLILRMISYNDVYSNRLKANWVGEVELVPWAQKI